MYKKVVLLMASLIILPMQVTVFAENNDLAKVEEKERFETTGEIKIGVQQVEEKKDDSSKFNEYRDIQDGFYLYNFSLEGIDNDTGGYLEIKGTDVGRDDQNLRFRIGGSGKWDIEFEWDEIPHNLSEKAKTPYDSQGNGLYTVQGNAGITSTSASTSQDESVSNFLDSNLHSTDLGIQREKGSIALSYTPTSRLKLKLAYSDDKKEGTQLTGAQLGDRPPRSLVVQLPEPVDYSTKDLKLEAEYAGDRYQIQLSHLISEFTNDVDSLRWESMFYGADEGADYNTIGSTTYSTYGEMALPPDNRYRNTSLSFGVNLPLESRLTASASIGKMEQDEALLSYSYSDFDDLSGATGDLPRTTADAEINTTQYNLEYTINLFSATNLHAFYRYYNLDNDTTQSQWQYETSDTLTSDTGSGVVNKRVNLAYAYKKDNYGLDLSHTLPGRIGTLGLGYENEKIDRDYREANTSENIYKASYRVMPLKWLSFKAKYLYGKRDSNNYDYTVTDASYWYTADEYTAEKDNPLVNYSNTPDLRKYDVSDRERNQWDFNAVLRPVNTVDINLSYMQRRDNFDSDVTSTTVVGYDGSTGEETIYGTVGEQLGLLKSDTNRYVIGTNYSPNDRLSFTADYGWELYKTSQKGIGASEDDKDDGDGWTDSARIWSAKIKDNTDTVGVGFSFVIIPKKLNFATNYTYSYGTVDIDYSGYGSEVPLSGDSDSYYAFTDPGKGRQRQHTVNATLEYRVSKGVVIGLGYLYDKYDINDWMQEAIGGWVEEAGSEYYLRDTTDSTQWGNRLVTMGSLLASDYENHVGMVTLAYKW